MSLNVYVIFVDRDDYFSYSHASHCCPCTKDLPTTKIIKSYDKCKYFLQKKATGGIFLLFCAECGVFIYLLVGLEWLLAF